MAWAGAESKVPGTVIFCHQFSHYHQRDKGQQQPLTELPLASVKWVFSGTILADNQQAHGSNQWVFSWGTSTFSSSKVYKALIGPRPVHPTFKWIWQSKCQMTHKVFFWLVLMDRINTRDVLCRKTWFQTPTLVNYAFFKDLKLLLTYSSNATLPKHVGSLLELQS